MSLSVVQWIGKRPYQEDVYVAKTLGERADWCFFAVLDGHGGRLVAERAARELCALLSEEPDLCGASSEEGGGNGHGPRHTADGGTGEGQSKGADGGGREEREDPAEVTRLTEALHRVLKRCDERIYEVLGGQRGGQARTQGCTVCAALYQQGTGRLIVFHVGDSRGLVLSAAAAAAASTGSSRSPNVLLSGGVKTRAMTARAAALRGTQLLYVTSDHKPNHPLERQRIQRAGGWVSSECSADVSRVWPRPGASGGTLGLALSRALGDFELKPRTCCEKELKERRRKRACPGPGEDPLCVRPSVWTSVLSAVSPALLLLASDGLWDVLSTEEVHQVLAEAESPAVACSQLLQEAKRRQSSDNVTVLCVRLAVPAPAPAPAPAPVPGHPCGTPGSPASPPQVRAVKS